MSEPVWIDCPWERLRDDELWFGKGAIGDIAASRIAGFTEDNPKRRVEPFTFEGRTWTAIGSCWCVRPSITCYPLIVAAQYVGTLEPVPYSYEGQLVTVKKAEYRLGARHEFLSTDRPVDFWQSWLRARYREGGYFTSEKSYHGHFKGEHEGTIWHRRRDVPMAEFAPNFVAACRLELSLPDWTKWKTEHQDVKAPILIEDGNGQFQLF